MAALLKWIDAYEIGIPVLDYEHRDLFARINDLHDELLRHEEKEKVEECLGELHARLSAHFALEEKVMRERGYRHYAEHKGEHDRFLDDFVDAITRFENDPGFSYGDDMKGELKRWIVDHVLTSDKEMAAMAE